MMKTRLVLLGFGILTALSATACATSTDDDETSESTEDELRSFKAGELLGTIRYGETKSVQHSASSTYRAFAFDAVKGDEIELTVSAAGHDAVAWLLGSANQTLTKANAFTGTRAESISYKATKTGRLHIAFREADYEPATFTVSLKKKPVAPPAAPSTVATCEGAPRFPTTGRVGLTSAIRYEYTRSCDAYGTCSEWTLANQRSASFGLGRLIELAPGGEIYAGAFGLGFSFSQSGSSTYVCRSEDAVRGLVVDASGKGSSTMQASERCDISGGSGGPRSTGDDRPVDVVVGQSCVSFAELIPAVASGVQKRVVYIAPLQQ